MLQAISLFAKRLLGSGGFRVSEFPKKLYRELVTAFENACEGAVQILPGMAELAKAHPGKLVIDDTKNAKYGLGELAKKLKILTSGATRQGYEVVLLLWVTSGGLRFPVAFALCHKGTTTPAKLAYEGLSRLRNHCGLRPEAVLADAGYATDDIYKLMDGYGWTLVVRDKKDRQVDGKAVHKLIPRGYGEITGHLNNDVKVKAIRSEKHFLFCNRMTLEREAIQALYRLRWKIEEVFRVLKSKLDLGGCKQHSMRAQGVFVFSCLLLFSHLEIVSGGYPYKALSSVISGDLNAEDLICEQFFLPL